ncbi:MAG: leucyl aminopeptidase family protein [Micromonosporaceae bacterium]|nr:leucyl aminopeptidase family protein [Micromonosporaceae bacterium]
MRTEGTLALPVAPGNGTLSQDAPPEATDDRGRLVCGGGLTEAELGEVDAFVRDIDHPGTAGTTHLLPRPTRQPSRLLLVGIGDGDEAGWRSAGAALALSARRDEACTVAMPGDAAPAAVRGISEGIWLASYRYRLGGDDPDRDPKLREVSLAFPGDDQTEADLDPMAGAAEALATAKAVAEATCFARDLTNTPSNIKNPAWFAERVVEAAGATPYLAVEVRDPAWLADQGFTALLSVGRASNHQPRLVRLAWAPPGATRHVVLVGKGITFDTGGIVLKPRDAMKLMRKDMGAAAAVAAAVLGAAALRLPVRVTALTPLAENAIGADAYRPGDVVRHVGGLTSEVLDTDAEGRLVLADALSYASRSLEPDVLVDLGTLTGAQHVALGRRTAALFSEDDTLASGLADAATAAGEFVWRMPLVDEYAEELRSDIADIANIASSSGGGAVTAALYLREFTGSARSRWAHLDMSAPAWSEAASAELTKGATGWGVRTLLRWLSGLAGR